MKFDLIQLLYVFDEELPLSNEELGIFWFKYTRRDNATIQLNFCIFENSYGLILRTPENVAASSIILRDCREINVISEEKRQIEIISEYRDGLRLRCFLDFESENLMELKIESTVEKWST